jgi:hypothetical protein
MVTARRGFLAPATRWLMGLALAVAASGAVQAGFDDPPGRVGRLADLQGKVWLFDAGHGDWIEAHRNRSLTTGDRLSTERGARAEVRVGSTELRLDAGTELEIARLDDERMVFQLHGGSVALRVRSRDIAAEVEVLTAEGRVVPERSGHYRVDREDDTTTAATWRGSLRFDAPDLQVQVPAGRRAEFFQQPGDGSTVVSWSAPETDAFADWVARDEQRDDRSVAQRYVSPEMTGAEDLDRYGRWESHPEYGMLWAPTQVVVGWAPYRHGRWGWHRRWGWTWIDDAPWGFAPFHYGRWVRWGGRWCWSPGAYVARPVYAPALVAWTGGPYANASIVAGGGPVVGWIPLGPRDIYVPGFHYGPRYFQQVNRPQHPHRPPQVPTGPVMYGNHGVPGAVTVVPSNVLAQRQPVAPLAVHDGDAQRGQGGARFRSESPGAPYTRVGAVPGTAQPVRVPPAPGGAVEQRRERPPPVLRTPVPAAPPTPAAVPVPTSPPAPAVAGHEAVRNIVVPSPKPAREAQERPGADRPAQQGPGTRQRIPESRSGQRERQNAN